MENLRLSAKTVPQFKRNSLLSTVFIFSFICFILAGSFSSWAEEAKGDFLQKTIGLLQFQIPHKWKALEGSDLQQVKSDFSSNMSLAQYDRTGEPKSHLDEFQIFQKPSDGQVIGWTIRIPEQKDFLKKIYNTEQAALKIRKAHIQSGECRLVRLGKSDVVRTDVILGNGAQTTNLLFWSPDNPGMITVLMVGMRASHSSETAKEFDEILSSVQVKETAVRNTKP